MLLVLMLAITSTVTSLSPSPLVDIVYEPESQETKVLNNKLIVNNTETAESGEHQIIIIEENQENISGKPFLLSCSTPDHADIELCTWRREGASQMILQQSGLYDYKRNKVEGVSVVKNDKRECSISIDHLSEADHGRWTCRVYHTGSKQWQEAHVEVGAKDKEDVNVRLPSNIKPSKYDSL